MAEQQYPEPTVGALIIGPSGRLFLMRSHKWFDRYVVPGGHIELGETMHEALQREVKEETGLDIYDVEFLCFQEFVYDPRFWQHRHFIFFDFVCRSDDERAVLNEEAEEYLWVEPEQALELPIDLYTDVAIRQMLARQNASAQLDRPAIQ